jgi:hypothetical protein
MFKGIGRRAAHHLDARRQRVQADVEATECPNHPICYREPESRSRRAFEHDRVYLFGGSHHVTVPLGVAGRSHSLLVGMLVRDSRRRNSSATSGVPSESGEVGLGNGKLLGGSLAVAGPDDVVLENTFLTIAVSASFDHPQLPGATVGKPIDLAVPGHEDQLDWINLPYVSPEQPSGPEAWRQISLRATDVDVDVVENSKDRAVVRVTGAVADTDLEVVTTYSLLPDEPWVTARSMITNTGPTPLPVWVGDVIDHDGTGQVSGVAGHGTITAAYQDPGAYRPSGRWIGMAGTDPQTYGLVYSPDGADFDAYGNGNWMMTRFDTEIPAGESFTLDRRVVVTINDADDPFAALESIPPG